MKIFLPLLISFLSISIGFSETYKQIKIQLNNPQDIVRLAETGIDLEGAIPDKENSIKIFVESSQLSKISSLGLNYTVTIEDWEEYYKNLPKMTEAELKQQVAESGMKYGVNEFVPNGSMTGHFTYVEIAKQLDTLKAMYPNLISAKVSLGTSVQGRDLWMVKISNSPNANNGKPEVLFTALTHAREPAGMMTTIYYMYYLLENYNTNPTVKYLVDNRQIYFMPCINPDGYVYNQSTNPTGGGMWRKNRRLNTGGSYGVDLNRNFGPMAYWNSALAPNGSSTVPTSDTYRGTAPFSEPENAAYQNFVKLHNFKTAFNYHTHGGYVVTPYGALARETPDSAIFREYASKISSWNGYTWGTDMQTVGYSTRGGSDDFMYDGDTTGLRGKCISMTPEVGTDGNFWAPQNLIIPYAQLNLNPNLFLTWVAGAYINLKNAGFQQQYFNPGDNVQMKPVFQNQGLSSGSNLTFNLTSLSSYATVTNGTVAVDSIPARSTKTLTTPFTFTLAANTPIEQKLKFVLETKTGTVSMAKDTISIIIGVPSYTFIDTTNNPLTLWTISATPTTPKWDATTASFNSAPNSYTDSKDGQYVANATVTMQSTNPISLINYANPRLSFWTKWDMETKWDCGIVQISSNNGSTWTTLTGAFTKPASGSGKQVPAGMPMYDGLNSSWVKEEMDLTSFAGQNIKLKFELRTDGSQNKDGWYVDDIGVFVYSAVPVEMNSFTANTVNNAVKLIWSTATELNNRGFEIERSLVNGPDKYWQNIGYVKGNGTTQQPNNYTFVDVKPVSGHSYYRLKQIDFNGTYRIYGPVEVDVNTKIDFALEQNYPNPFNPSTVIKYSIPQNDVVTLKLYNILGSEVAVLVNEYKEAGKYEFNMNIDNIKGKIGSGVYFYTIKSGSFSETRKMVILK